MPRVNGVQLAVHGCLAVARRYSHNAFQLDAVERAHILYKRVRIRLFRARFTRLAADIYLDEYALNNAAFYS